MPGGIMMRTARVVLSMLTVMGLSTLTGVAAPTPAPAVPSLAVAVIAREFLYEPKDIVAKAGMQATLRVVP